MLIRIIVTLLTLLTGTSWLNTAFAQSRALKQALERGTEFYRAGQYKMAEPQFAQALKLMRKEFPGHPNEIRTLYNLSFVYEQLGQYSQAERLLQQALTILREKLDHRHPPVGAEGLNNLGVFYSRIGRHFEAERLLEEALAIAEKAPDKDQT